MYDILEALITKYLPKSKQPAERGIVDLKKVKLDDEKLDDFAKSEIQNKIQSSKYLRKNTSMTVLQMDEKFEDLIWSFIIKFESIDF